MPSTTDAPTVFWWSRPPGAREWTLLGLILVATLWLRGHTFGPTVAESTGLALWPVLEGGSEPLDCDEAAYAYIGRELAEGRVMYRDLTENKPPLGYWLYATAVAVGGANEMTIRLLVVPFVLASLVLVHRIARTLAGPLAGLLAAVAFALMSTDPRLFGNGSNFEHFINFFTLVALASGVRALRPQPEAEGEPERRRASWVWWLLAGLAVGLAALVKQVAMLTLAALGWIAWRGEPRRGWGGLAALGMGVVTPMALALIVLAAQGALEDARADILEYGRMLANDVPAEPGQPPGWVRWLTGNSEPNKMWSDNGLPWPFGPSTYHTWWGGGSWPLWALSGPAWVWVAMARRRSPDASARHLVALATLTAWAQVVAPGLYWQHYYLLVVPCVAVVVGVLGGDSWRLLRRGTTWFSRLAAALSLAVCGVALAATGFILTRDYLLVPPAQVTARYKGGNQWIVLRDLGREWGERLRRAGIERPTLYNFGWQSPLFIYGDMDCPTRHFFADPVFKTFAPKGDPRVADRVARTLADLEANPPDLVVLGYVEGFPALRPWLAANYLPVPFGKMPALARVAWLRRDLTDRVQLD